MVQMTYYCKLCEKTVNLKSKYKHFKSKTHKSHSETIIRTYIVLITNFQDIDAIMMRYINKHKEKYEGYDVRCVLKFLTTKIVLVYLKLTQNLVLIIVLIFTENLILSRIKQ